MVSKGSTRGLFDWIVQRVSALLVLVYMVIMLVMLVLKAGSGQAAWLTLFQLTWIKWLTLLVSIALMWHAWIGLWTIFTDYVHHTGVRRCLEILVCGLMLMYLVWILTILW